MTLSPAPPTRMLRSTRRPLAVLLLVFASLGGCTGAALDAPEVLTPVDFSAGDDEISTIGPALLEPVSFDAVSYDGSGELVHPDAVVLPRGWKGSRFWFSATPYPHGDARFENPSLFRGDAADDWELPLGAKNPLAMPETDGYLSDPDLVLDPVRSELRMYYRQTLRSVDQIYLMTSRDGANWSNAQRVLESARYALISPALVRETDGTWRMWTVNAHTSGCRARADEMTLSQRRSPDGITWGSPASVQLVIPGRVPWHWDVQYIASKHEYWSLVAAYRDGKTCSESSLYFARSVDGTDWVVSPSPLLGPGMLPALNDLVYRSTFRYFSKSDVVDVWFSGARLEGSSYHFALATARYPVSELLARVERTAAVSPDRGREGETHLARLRAAREAFANDFP